MIVHIEIEQTEVLVVVKVERNHGEVYSEGAVIKSSSHRRLVLEDKAATLEQVGLEFTIGLFVEAHKHKRILAQ
jgi:hypothetical protein